MGTVPQYIGNDGKLHEFTCPGDKRVLYQRGGALGCGTVLGPAQMQGIGTLVNARCDQGSVTWLVTGEAVCARM